MRIAVETRASVTGHSALQQQDFGGE